MTDIENEDSRLRPETLMASLSIIKTAVETYDVRFRPKIRDFATRTETNRNTDYYYATFETTRGAKDYVCEVAIQQDANGELGFAAAIDNIKADRSKKRILLASLENTSLKMGCEILARTVASALLLDT